MADDDQTQKEDLTSDDAMTPEERLLKVIDNEGKSIQETEAPRFARPTWKDLFNRAGGPFRFKFNIQNFNLQTINQILKIAIVLGVIVTGINTFAFKPGMEKIYERVSKVSLPEKSPHEILPLEPIESYLAVITNTRNIFQPISNQPVVTDTGEVVAVDSKTNEILDNLQLVGIAWGTYPEAMIHDKKEQRTHFLKEDQQFKGIKIKAILKDRVIVEVGGQERELL